MAYDNTNSGMLMRNERRQSDNHPEFTGSINVEGVDYWVSAWVNEGKPGSKIEGKKYFSLRVNRKDKAAGTKSPTSHFSDDYDADVPF